MSTKIPVELNDDILSLIVRFSMDDRRSVDNWLDNHFRHHFYGSVAMRFGDEPQPELPNRSRKPIPAFVKKKVFELSGGVCSYCKIPISPFKFHVDHVVPIAKGGSSDIDNLAAACADCNQSKKTHDAEIFRKVLAK